MSHHDQRAQYEIWLYESGSIMSHLEHDVADYDTAVKLARETSAQNPGRKVELRLAVTLDFIWNAGG